MKNNGYLMILLVPLLFAGTALISDSDRGVATDDGVAFHQDQHEYVGATKCRTCHRKEEDGEQYPIWEKSAHAKAYQTLGTDEAKKIAAEKGIDNPQTADECLKCHVTGHGVAEEYLGTKYDMTEGVTCESCHGPGGDYYKKSTMEGIMKGEIDKASVGLNLPDEETCVTCHNDQSPTFDGFDFDEYKAKIEHPIPDAKKAEYK